MRRLIIFLLIGSALSGGTNPVQAHDERGRTMAWLRWGSLDREINHLNRMVGHVRWQLGRYHADRAVRRDFDHIRSEVDRVNAIHRRGDYDHRELRREIARWHERLHDLEIRLRVRRNDFYRWP